MKKLQLTIQAFSLFIVFTILNTILFAMSTKFY